jgi:hypothetical protein
VELSPSDPTLDITVGKAPEQTPIVLEPGKLIAWQCTEAAPLIRAAAQTRQWMEEANDGFPYRCLPLVIANQLGWDILNPATLIATWNGGPAPADVTIRWPTKQTSNMAVAHFGVGILTFTLGHLFQTPPGINLMVMGPPNWPKDGVVALMGVVETDWLPATFTMNWRFTRKDHEVIFEAGEPICRIFPIPRHITEYLTPEIRMLTDNHHLSQDHMVWRSKREEFNNGLKVPGSIYTEKKWQRDYFKGGGALWDKFEDHQTRLPQPEFADYRPDAIRAKDQVPKADTRPLNLVGPNGKAVTIFIPNRDLPYDINSSRINSDSSSDTGSSGRSVSVGPTEHPSHTSRSSTVPSQPGRTEVPDTGTSIRQNSGCPFAVPSETALPTSSSGGVAEGPSSPPLPG